MPFLKPAEKETLVAVCDTLIPSLEPEEGDDPALFRLSASDLNIADHVESSLERITTGNEKLQVRLTLRALNTGLFNGVLAGHWAPLRDMPLAAREAVLYRLSSSRFESARVAFLTFKRLATFLFYAVTQDGIANPTWKAFDYHAPPSSDPEPDAPRIQPLKITSADVLDTDVLVIGSGAGGGVVAGELARAGHQVIVVEKGEYYPDHAFPRSEAKSMETMYEKYGSLVTEDKSMSILAGSTLGGGTTVNWSASFRTPPYVLEEWEKVIGFSGATGTALQESFDAVSKRMNISTSESVANPNNQKLQAGSDALGFNCEVVPRNVKGCEVCDFCNYGCQFGAKQGTLKTYLQDAYDDGARIIVRAYVDRILHERGQVRAAVVKVTDDDGQTHLVTIKAKAIIVSAGTIHTPAILMRSGLTNRNIGQNLYLHPTTVITGLFEDRIEPWRGAPLTRVVKDWLNLDGNGYGVWLENAPAHPGLNGLANPWTSGREHKRVVQHLAHTANIIILNRDRDAGHIKLSQDGKPQLHYRLSDYDAAHLMVGLKKALEIHVAAGATEVAAPHNDRPAYIPGSNGSLESFLSRVEQRGLRPNDFALFSAHQMGTARIGGDPARGAVNPTGESWEVKGLFVADGAALPNAPGVNPMLSILAVSHYIAQHIKAGMN